MRLPRRSFRHLAALVVGAWLAAAGSSFAHADRVFTVTAPFEITGADPAELGFIFQRMEIGQTLVETNRSGVPEPGLAMSWSVSPDRLTWTLPLRPGVRFHDGTLLTAELAVASLEKARQRPGPLGRAGIRTISARDGAVVITLSAPFAPLWGVLAHFSTMILAPSSFAEDGTVRTIVGTGPFRLTRLTVPSEIEMEAFPGYWGQRPGIRRARYLASKRGETRAGLIEDGEADLAIQVDPSSLARLEASGSADVLRSHLPSVMQLKINSALPPFDTAEGRRAVSEAVEREGISRAILRAPGTSAEQLIPPTIPSWYDPSLPPLPTDPDEARAKLARLGWTVGADGILVKDGKRLRVRLLTYPDRPELPLVATALVSQFREIGMEVELVVTDSAAVPAEHEDGTLEMALVVRNYLLAPDPFLTILEDFGGGGSDWGATNWRNPAFDKATEALLATGDPNEAARLRHTIVRLLQSDLPVIPIVWYDQNAAVSTAVEGAEIDASERSYGISRMRWKH